MDFDTFWRRVRRSRIAEERGLVISRRIPSSHELARRAAREYHAEGNTVPASDFLAWHQTAGQGRHGRHWSSPAGGGVYASMVRRLRASQVRALPMTVPTALVEALREEAGIECRVKWPNDLMIQGKKLGGVLIDVVGSGDGDPIAVVSFGINHGAVSRFDESRAISVSELGSGITLDVLASSLMDRVDRGLRTVSDVSEILPVYRDLSVHSPGDPLECRLEDGQGSITRGTFVGIDGQGLLRLKVGDTEHRLSAGRLVGP